MGANDTPTNTLLVCALITMVAFSNYSEAISECAKDCMPTCMKVKEASISVCKSSCEDYCEQVKGRHRQETGLDNTRN